MTRNDVLKIFPTASEEDITALLNAHQSEMQAEKSKAKNLKDTSKELEEARAEIEALKSKDTGAPEDWQSQIAKLTEANEKAQLTIKNMELKNNLLSQGFVAEDVDEYIKTVNEGGDIASVLGKMRTNAISAHDKERMERMTNPKGSGQTPPDEKDTASKLVSQMFGDSSNKNNTDILAYYK
ncbi:MAG: hypothetical protein J6S67_19280 [Methanobrevibacter sp.]|nr:hypothetical protein [Methanobrevibacter sp.]